MGTCSASDFVASKGNPFSGFGLSGHCPFFDPTDAEEDSRATKPSIIFGKSVKEINGFCGGDAVQLAIQMLRRSLTVYNDLSFVPENATKNSSIPAIGKDRIVQNHHLDEIARGLFESQLITPTICGEDTSMSDLDCGEGIVDGRLSVPDGCFIDSRDHVRGIFEVTDGAKAPAEVMRNGAAEATNVAIMQLKLGVNVTEIVVPVVGSNGYLMQFGAVIMLQPSFPTFIMLTHVLDLTEAAALTEAARMLCCIKILVSTELTSTNAEIPYELVLSTSRYHCKPLKDFYTSTGNMQSSLYHYFEIMAHLHKNAACRKFIVFPICVREYEDSLEESSIVFPKLNDASYKVGLPATPELRASFLDQLKKAITAFHDAGVVHFDLFLSNIMWRQLGPNEVQLKIIDWDSAQFIHEGIFLETMQRLRDTSRRNQVRDEAAKELQVDRGNAETMMKMYDISLLRVLEKNIDEPALTAGEKRDPNDAFIYFQKQYAKMPVP